ncbi:copper homeostasis protein CutC [Clostridium beijerinckii]|uniref:PF03932 family protein CutC n=1 Tax=Clostridium beijerinckii TaxID=1520 RepID=A0AAX0AY58_CLOBE|nr:copper homeostasis protein CutC [Clostridium beijerinckii]NRT34994.1 copper homeostasis protein [Clostridium beijerinckii]NRT45577.1 copper homeostasis protein [Clostridium beijerinckii]NRT87657.1 copper homeostasis protein [Clostridium beijerinckii]NRZ20426.1 copper homeostasis protein [Clostridium beijerinckii]NYC73087.1 copper homeostasis protein [Clostridium beijerinckii]
MIIFEACVGNYDDAILAAKRGANRIELCDNLIEGGTTPSYGTIRKIVEDLDIPIMVIIRPRGGSFTYTKEELEIMKYDVKMCKELGVHGVVIGAVKDSKVDKEIIEELVNLAKPMTITFHMAFDEVEDKKIALDEIIKLGIDRILTKGGCENAMAGKECLKDLVKYADGRISIMPGKGITKENRDFLLEYTGAVEIHGTRVV